MSKVLFGDAPRKIYRVDFVEGDSGGRQRVFGVAVSEEAAKELAAAAINLPVEWAVSAVSLGMVKFDEEVETATEEETTDE